MLITDYIKVYEGAIPMDFCEELIAKFDTSENVEEDIERLDDGRLVRSNLQLNVNKEPGMEGYQAAMMKITELAVGKYQAELPIRTFPKEIGCEVFRMKKYRVDPAYDDHYDYHVDVNSHSSARRYVAMFWYLNDVTEGGDLFFPHPNLRIKPKKGRLVMFPSLWNYPHAAEHPISNDKYVIGTYLHYL